MPTGQHTPPGQVNPWVSPGPLKVITVSLFQSSALALGASAAPISAMQQTVVTALNSFISFFLRSGFCTLLFAQSGFPRQSRCHVSRKGSYFAFNRLRLLLALSSFPNNRPDHSRKGFNLKRGFQFERLSKKLQQSLYDCHPCFSGISVSETSSEMFLR